MSAFLEVTDLTVQYGSVEALRRISFSVNAGEIVTLIGANGAGKTSTLMAISNLVSGGRKGRIIFDGTDITRMESSKIVRLGIGHVPEGRHIFPRITVEENLLMGSFGQKRFDRKLTEEQIARVYGMFPRLKERRSQMGGTLSGGEQQMLAIGRGLISMPRLLMLDEPSLGLAPLVVQEIFDLIRTIRDQGTTVLLIEQNAGMALQIADRGYVLENGSITLEGTGKELYSNDKVIQAYLGL